MKKTRKKDSARKTQQIDPVCRQKIPQPRHAKEVQKEVQNEIPPHNQRKQSRKGSVNHQDNTLSSGLYIVATPIGNLADFSPRARTILAFSDYILCEDTRVARRLLSAYGLQNRLISYHDHNAKRVRPKILPWLKKGAAMALISDAGTPLISDPGLKLVQLCHQHDIPLFTIPGPNAALAALVLSGLPCDRFFFAGFLPPRQAARRREITRLQNIPGSLIFYEQTHRLASLLTDLEAGLGNRPAVVARELTKLHEQIHRHSLKELAAYYAKHTVRGEIVVLVGPADQSHAQPDLALDSRLNTILTKALLTHHSTREAAALVARQTGFPKRLIYAQAVKLSASLPQTTPQNQFQKAVKKPAKKDNLQSNKP